jgi:hypothetical protein
LRVVAATATTPLQLAGDVPDASLAELPAATTTTVPRAVTSLTAFWKALPHGPDPPRLKLTTRAGFALAGTPATAMPEAQRIASTTSEV